MGKFDWKQTLATVAPAIATALGTPLAGVAVSMASQALGLSEESEEALANAVRGGDPATLAKLKEIDASFKVQMKELDVRLEEISANDRASARTLAAAKGIVVQAVLTFILTFVFSWIIWALFEGKTGLDERTENIAFYAMGTLNGLLIQAWNFWFGTSKGSKDKTDYFERFLGK